MGTVQEHYDDLHYYIRETDEGEIRLEMIKKTGESSGIEVDVISKEDFAARFKHCSEHDCSFRPKTKEELQKKKIEQIEKVAGEHLKKKEYPSAEFEFGKALKMDEESVMSNYGIGKVYLETGRVEEAKKVFNKLSKIEALFEKENKHIFNDFGIDLRKQNMFDEAVENYKKAISIDQSDEILYYNLGRACKEKGDFDAASEYVQKAIDINPDFKEAKDYLPFLISRKK